MVKKINITSSGAIILKALADRYRYGFDIMDVTGLPSGTVYPLLRRMEQAGLIDSKWENAEEARLEQRPPRKYYELTGAGEEALIEARKRYRFLDGISPAAAPKEKPSN